MCWNWQAIELLEKAVKLTPDHEVAHGALAMALLEHRGEARRAADEMKGQIALNPMAASLLQALVGPAPPVYHLG